MFCSFVILTNDTAKANQLQKSKILMSFEFNTNYMYVEIGNTIGSYDSRNLT